MLSLDLNYLKCISFYDIKCFSLYTWSITWIDFTAVIHKVFYSITYFITELCFFFLISRNLYEECIDKGYAYSKICRFALKQQIQQPNPGKQKKRKIAICLFFFFLPDILAVNWLHTIIVFVFHNCISNPIPWEYVDKFDVT